MPALVAMLLSQTCSAPFVCVDGDQTYGGYKVATQLQQFTGLYSWSSGALVSTANYGGIALGGPVVPLLDGQGMVYLSRRAESDPAPGHIFYGGHADFGDCDEQLFVVDKHTGNVTFGAALQRMPDGGCQQAADVLHRGMMVVGNGASGAVAMRSAPGGRVIIEYELAAQCAKLPDGGEPQWDGGFDVEYRPDAGFCFSYAGAHGGVEAASTVPQQQGFAFATINPGVYGGLMKFYVHATGAFGQANGLWRHEFPTCPSPLAMTSLGQFYPGVPPGAHAYASDEDREYVCKLTGWEAQ